MSETITQEFVNGYMDSAFENFDWRLEDVEWVTQEGSECVRDFLISINDEMSFHFEKSKQYILSEGVCFQEQHGMTFDQYVKTDHSKKLKSRLRKLRLTHMEYIDMKYPQLVESAEELCKQYVVSRS